MAAPKQLQNCPRKGWLHLNNCKGAGQLPQIEVCGRINDLAQLVLRKYQWRCKTFRKPPKAAVRKGLRRVNPNLDARRMTLIKGQLKSEPTQNDSQQLQLGNFPKLRKLKIINDLGTKTKPAP